MDVLRTKGISIYFREKGKQTEISALNPTGSNRILSEERPEAFQQIVIAAAVIVFFLNTRD
jgi:hypothetical protein